MQKMTTIASPQDARHLNNMFSIRRPPTNATCFYRSKLQILQRWTATVAASWRTGRCQILQDFVGSPVMCQEVATEMVVVTAGSLWAIWLTATVWVCLSHLSPAVGWMSFFTSALAWKLRCSFSGWRDDQPSEKYHGLPPSIASRKVWHGKNWKIICAMLGMFCWLPSILPWQCLHEKWWTVPSGEGTFCYGKSPCLMGKSTINGHFPLLC